MGMSIKKAIHTMEYYDECDITTQRQARAKAVGVMQKYQKIKTTLDKIETILDMDISYGHFAKEMKLSAVSRVVHGKKQEEQLWKFLDEVEDGKID